MPNGIKKTWFVWRKKNILELDVVGPVVTKSSTKYFHHFGQWAKIIFGGKLGNPSFCHIDGMERPNKFLKKRQVLVSPRI